MWPTTLAVFWFAHPVQTFILSPSVKCIGYRRFQGLRLARSINHFEDWVFPRTHNFFLVHDFFLGLWAMSLRWTQLTIQIGWWCWPWFRARQDIWWNETERSWLCERSTSPGSLFVNLKTQDPMSTRNAYPPGYVASVHHASHVGFFPCHSVGPLDPPATP